MLLRLLTPVLLIVPAACQEPEQITPRAPQFSGICGSYVSVPVGATALDVNRQLSAGRLTFCAWHSQMEMLAYRSVSTSGLCPPDAGGERAFRFSSIRDFEKKCISRGIQVTNPATFELAHEIRTMTPICYAPTSEKSPKLDMVQMVLLGTELYQRYGLPIKYSFAAGEMTVFWLDAEDDHWGAELKVQLRSALEQQGFLAREVPCPDLPG